MDDRAMSTPSERERGASWRAASHHGPADEHPAPASSRFIVDRARDAERASLVPARESSRDDDLDRDRRRASFRWPSASTVRAIAFAATAFALGAATGSASRGSRDAAVVASAREEAARTVDDAVRRARAHATPALGLSQYERDLERARTATSRATRHAPRHPPSSSAEGKVGETDARGLAITPRAMPHLGKNATGKNATRKVPAGDPQGEYDEYEESEYSAGTFEKDERRIIKGVEPALESTRKRLLDRNKEDENDMGYYRFPTVANGVVAFVSETNIWVAPLRGATASRLSSTYSREGVPRLSPDGLHVAFLGLTYDGYDVFIAPTNGGIVEQVTFGGKAQDVASWSSPSELLVISSAFSAAGNPQLVKVNPRTLAASPLPFARATDGIKDGLGCYVFVPLRQTSETKRYEGGEQSRLWRWCKGDDEATQLTPESSWGVRGAWSPASSSSPELSDQVFFISDKTGVANVWAMNLTSGKPAVQLTEECLFDIKEFSVDYKHLIYRRGSSLFMRPIQGIGARLHLGEEVELNYELVSEFRKTMETEIEDPYASMSEFVLTNDGAFAAFVIRGQVYYSALVPFLGSRVEKVTRYSGAVRYKHIQFVNDGSRDGQPKLLALSDATGEYEYVLLERQVEGGHWKETAITTGSKLKGAMEFSSISPDNTALILADSDGNLKLVNLTETAVNTLKFRTTEPERVSAKLAKRSPKAAKLAQAPSPDRKQTSLFVRPPKRLSDRQRSEANANRRASRRARISNRRANKHLSNIGLLRAEIASLREPHRVDPSVSAIDGLANIQIMLRGFRPEGVYGLSWSPDGSYVAYAKDEENDFTSIHVLKLSTGESTRITTPSYNAHSPKFSPDGLYLYYFSDQQIASSANSPYGSRGAEPVFSETSRLMCVPLRMGMTCPFFIGDELNAEGSVFDAAFGKALATVISTHNIEQRAQPVPDLPDAQFLNFDIIADGSGMLLTVAQDDHVILASYSMYTRQILPLFEDPVGVVVSGDLQMISIVTSEGVALLSSKAALTPGATEDAILGSMELWKLPETFSVTVNPREEWLQMYEESMRNMRDSFYDPKLHGADWASITDRYRPLVYKISSKGELRDILGQAFGELSALHVFVSIKSEDPVIPLGTPSACLGADFETVPEGLKISYIHESSGILEAPHSALSRSTVSSFVNLLPGDIITKIDGVFVNSTSRPLSELLRGKAGMQVLLEVIKTPRSADEKRDEEDLLKIKQLTMMQRMLSGGGFTSALAATPKSKPVTDSHVADLVRKHVKLGARFLRSRARRDDADVFDNSDAHLYEYGRKGRGGHIGSELAAEKTVPAKGKDADEDEVDEDGGPELIVVTPLSLEQCDALQAADQVVRRREYVRKQTNGNVAYVYLEDMEQMGRGSSNSFDDFAAQFYPNVRKDGLIIDVRRNAGGNIDTWLLERLRRVAWMFDTERSGPGDTTMQYTFRGKVVVLIDEQTSSDAEMFALGIQQLKIGTVIGERTWGGAIGYSGHPELRLVDGSGFTIPSFGPYLNGDWAIEQKGVTPDVVVSNLPVATFHGKDAQLDAAIETIKKMIASSPSTDLPKPPTYPDRSFDARACAAKRSEVADGAA